jgi:Zn ribbon nucleic-acid-binding protein
MAVEEIASARCPNCADRAAAWLDGLDYKQVCDTCGHEVWGRVTPLIAAALPRVKKDGA